jgi:hypothetical protein
MKNKLLLLALAITITACEYYSEPAQKQETQYGLTFDILVIDSCEYLFLDYRKSAIFTHKGNCKNSIHKLKNK